jgi:hypothetical protein
MTRGDRRAPRRVRPARNETPAVARNDRRVRNATAGDVPIAPSGQSETQRLRVVVPRDRGHDTVPLRRGDRGRDPAMAVQERVDRRDSALGVHARHVR